MIKILISACLVGERVRYDGKKMSINSPILAQWLKDGRLVSFCPEVAGGMPVPRPPAEIQSGDGGDVLNGKAKIMNSERVDVTDHFLQGTRRVIQFLENNTIKMAVLKSLSPACSVHGIYDGSFSRKIRSGVGILAAFLQDYPVQLFNENQLESAFQYLQKLESEK